MHRLPYLQYAKMSCHVNASTQTLLTVCRTGSAANGQL